MTRQEVYQEIEETFGLIPSMFKAVPDSSLELEWQLFKRVQLEEGPIPNKYRELIGLAIAGVTKCRYCAFYHTEVAKLFGATDEEIEDALHFAKSSAGWSTYINGLQLDFDQFKDEIVQACEHVRSTQAVAR
jgi:AhpD family alkylhydroperoxidase